eukprot:CAMPEP_0202860620 /NCGR_PEP_ID=MMETSP1391-20130828/2265_1 /ASSEMBLY_ACC=CAM_ASM_000867 /TAXON_ID=1034604 /ORGANISM="Chlamydomonas leiostraca, Strain SAG 11-49" /LENGTH=214 /DNA_ID=CAMNT_0049539831 /DNA_START=229 /DNA_END=873 /DNA_ORIENTATION=-
MVGNWWEDRYVDSTKRMTTTERVFARDLGGDGTDYVTTKQLDSLPVQNKAPSPKPLPKPSMYPTEEVLKERLDTYMPGGKPPAQLHYTLGRTMPQEAAEIPKRHLTTTNHHFYDDLPAAAKAAHPERFPPPDFTHSLRSPLTKGDLQDGQHLTASHGTEAAGKGNRGEITRNPREAGNPYGVSVFCDEYSQWGSKLGGKMTLGETVSRKMTSYF